MAYVTYVYSKIRKTFGKQPLFQTVPAHMVDSIFPAKLEERNYCLRNPVHREVQATLPTSEHEANTTKVELRETGIDHTEGGWPKDVHLYNEEHLIRHRRRVCHDENYIHTVNNMSPIMAHYIAQNNAIEMYQTYFTEYPAQNPVENYQIRVSNSFADVLRRPVSCVTWTNEQHAKLVVAYSHRCNNLTNIYDSDTCSLWDIERQNKPVNEINPDCSCWQLACSPVEPSILVGGLQDGTVSVFDLRGHEEAVLKSPVHVSHRDPITSLLYTHSRTNTELFSGSPDGQCLWWDTRNLSNPVDSLPMSIRISSKDEPNLSNAEGISSLQFDRGLPTRFLCGTESGLVINGNRMGRNHSEVLSSYWETHSGPVHAVHRSPCFSRMFITCGDWTVRIWSEEVHSAPIIVTKPYQSEVRDVAWATLRWSSYMAVCANGGFYYWDILRKQREPVASFLVSKYELTKVKPHCDGSLVAAGDTNGTTYLVQLSENMTYPGDSDKQLVQQIYERQRRREHILEARVKEIRLKARVEEELATALNDEEVVDEDTCQTAEEEYWRVVNSELKYEVATF